MDSFINNLLDKNNGELEIDVEKFGEEEALPEDELPLSKEDEFDAVTSLYARYNVTTRKYYCTACDLKTRRKHALQTHVRMHTKDRPYNCNLCSFKSSYKSSLIQHKKRHMIGAFIKCLICQKLFLKQTEYMIHKKVHTGEEEFKCRYCDFVTSISTRILIKHELTHNNITDFDCSLCEFTTKARIRFERHLRTHFEPKSNIQKCTQCEFTSDIPSKLKTHRRRHYLLANYKCPHCSRYATNDKLDFDQHLLSHSQGTPKVYNCDKCRFRCNTKKVFEKHQLSHGGYSTPFACGRCPFAAHISTELIKHVRTKHADTYS